MKQGQRLLFDVGGTCPECGKGAIAIQSRGKWVEFRAYFGGGKAWPKPKRKATNKAKGRGKRRGRRTGRAGRQRAGGAT